MTPLPRTYRRLAATAAASMTALLALLTVTTACQKDLERGPNYERTRFSVTFDWTDVRDAAPSEMQLVVFPDAGGDPIDYGFAGQRGGELTLPAGDFKTVAFNSDTETLTGSGTTWKDYEVAGRVTELTRFNAMFAATRTIPRAAGSENEPIVLQPEMLWTASAAEMHAGDDASESVTMKMRPAVYTYHFTIENVSNMGYITNIAVTVSGMSASTVPSSGLPSDRRCTIPATVTLSGTSTIQATVRTFGHCPDQEDTARHSLTVYAQLMDGSKWYYDFDVTGQMHDGDHTVPDVGGNGNVEVPIELTDLPFPKPFTNGSGMHPSVDEWQAVEVELNL